jgi:ASC-1-like (ASCH) protein
MLHSHLEIYASAIAIREFRGYRKMRNGMPLSSVMSGQTDEEEMVQRLHPR